MAAVLSNQQAAEEYAEQAAEVFISLHGSHRKGFRIEEVEDRGISISQLKLVLAQVKKRCKKEGWKDIHGNQLTVNGISLYDVVKYIIFPVTKARKTSYVEAIASGRQEPKWFVSHWWGEPLVAFIKCLEEHAQDHALSKDDTFYWVCAYANNQWKLELGETLKDSPFYKALSKSEGTVSILDKTGVVFSRIWCGYELYLSLLNDSNPKFKWCVYTTTNFGINAVGLTEGDAPNELRSKWNREGVFPLDLLENALSIDITTSQASVESDKDKILQSIGDSVDDLNSILKGRFAVSGLRLILERNPPMWLEFLRAIENGKSKILNFDFSNCEEFNETKQEELRKHIDWNSLEQLYLNFRELKIGNAGAIKIANDWHVDKIVELNLRGNGIGIEGAVSLANVLEKSRRLRHLDLSWNKIGDEGTVSLSNAIKEMESLEVLNLYDTGIGNEGALSLANAIKANVKLPLQKLLLDFNKIEDEGVAALANMLKENKTVLELNLGFNRIGNEGAKALANMLEENRTVLELILKSNRIGDDGGLSLANALKGNKVLQYLTLETNRSITGEAKAEISLINDRQIYIGETSYY